jgi:Ran GTPase-activating protein (RanGAP) involved in mRNA processing and transport
MSSLHVGGNDIPEKAMREIMAIAAGKENMKVLCEVPFKDKTLTELDVSDKNLGAEGALVVTEYLDGNGALTSLNLSSNNLKAEGAKIVAEAIKVTSPSYECDCDRFGTIFMSDHLAELLLFTAIHRITRPCRASTSSGIISQSSKPKSL